jgi:hypothetical protein
MRKSAAFVVLAFAAALLASACGGGKEADGGHYENAELGFAFDYPDHWEQVKEPLRAAEEIGEADTLATVLLGRLVEDPLHVEGMGLTVNRLRVSIPEEDLEEALLELDALIAQLMGQAGGAIAEADWTELGGVMARRYFLNFPHPVGVPMTSEKVVTFRGDLQFELDCQAVADRFQEVRPGCQDIYESFEFTSSPEGQPAATAAHTEAATSTPGAPAIGKIAFHSDRDGNFEIYVMNADGAGQTNLTNDPAGDNFPAWSPDGSRIAFHSDRDGNFEIYVMNADGSGLGNLTNNPADDAYAAWSPDGTRIAFSSDRDGNFEIYLMNADGTGLARLTDNAAEDSPPRWSPDGTRIAFVSDRDGNTEIYVMNADGTGLARLTDNPAEDSLPSWSPDGTRIVFHSDRDGNTEIYVMNADGSGQARLTNNAAIDGFPAWSPDGERIVFVSDRDGNFEIYVMVADGTGLARLTDNADRDNVPVWSPVP